MLKGNINVFWQNYGLNLWLVALFLNLKTNEKYILEGSLSILLYLAKICFVRLFTHVIIWIIR